MKILDGAVWRAAERRPHVTVAEPARRHRVDLVAARHARDLLACEQHEVERRRRERDQGFDPPPEGELAGCAMRHGARL